MTPLECALTFGNCCETFSVSFSSSPSATPSVISPENRHFHYPIPRRFVSWVDRVPATNGMFCALFSQVLTWAGPAFGKPTAMCLLSLPTNNKFNLASHKFEH